MRLATYASEATPVPPLFSPHLSLTYTTLFCASGVTLLLRLRICGVPKQVWGMKRVLILVVALTACSPRPGSTIFDQLPPQAPNHPIRIYQDTRPECPVEELGEVNVGGQGVFSSTEAALAVLRAKSRELGGDAAVLVTEFGRFPMSGVVIRFTNPQCQY